MDTVAVHIAVMTIAADAATADRATARAISERATNAGHQIVDEEVVKDSESAIRDQLVRWIAEPNIDVVIVAASVESEAASAALAPLVMQTLPGFTDLFRWLTFQEIGASAMLSAAEAAQCESTFVFVLPAHEVAVRAAMDKLILPQLDARTKPKNLVMQMPRLKDEAKRVQAAPQAVPMPIASEKTTGGSGVQPKPPARGRATTANTIARKPDDPPTKPIDLAKLEKQIALSNQNETQTKEIDLGAHNAQTRVVDMSAHQAKTKVVDMSRLPRLPPGADDTGDDDADALRFTKTPPTGVSTASVRPAGPIGVVKIPSIRPVAKPAAPAPPREVAVTPAPLPVVPPTPASTRPPTTPPPRPATPPPVAKATPPAAVPVVAPAKPEVIASDPSISLSDLEEVVDDVPEQVAPPPVAASAPAAPAPAAPTPAPQRKLTQPPPVDPLADITARPLANALLPQGDFVYPIKRSGAGVLLKILVGLAVLGLGFFAFVELYPHSKPAQTAAVTPEPAPSPAVPLPVEPSPVEPPPVEAAPAAPSEPAPSAPAPEPAPAEPVIADTTKSTRSKSRASKSKPETSTATTPNPETPTTTASTTSETKASPPAPEPAGDPSCDEVSCVMSKYDRPCCERYRPADSFKPKNVVPDELDKPMVKAAVEKIKPKVVACGEKKGATGTVKIAVTVDSEGNVKSASVTESPDQALGECVAAAMRKAKFGKTVNGGEFVYPFVF